MKLVKLKNIKYIGADIVPEIIKKNKKLKLKGYQFLTLNIIKDSLPDVDLMLCRDCLTHLSYESIHQFLNNLSKTKIKYLLTTSYINNQENKDIVTGNWRKLNFQKFPFNFPNPIDQLNEKCPLNGSEDKSLLLWEVTQLKYLLK
tara:strand:+ start:4787 stop:5221 length:435 start_codon:yes stop_codon:yes gene_type:complete